MTLERGLAIYTLISATLHFSLETYHFVQYGSFLPMLIVDYIAISLFVFASYVALSNRYGSAAGLLCGAWGFAFCLNYRAFFWRYQELVNGTAQSAEPMEVVASILGVTLIISGSVFLLTLWMAFPKRVKAEQPG